MGRGWLERLFRQLIRWLFGVVGAGWLHRGDRLRAGHVRPLDGNAHDVPLHLPRPFLVTNDFKPDLTGRPIRRRIRGSAE